MYDMIISPHNNKHISTNGNLDISVKVECLYIKTLQTLYIKSLSNISDEYNDNTYMNIFMSDKIYKEYCNGKFAIYGYIPFWYLVSNQSNIGYILILTFDKKIDLARLKMII